MWMENRTRSLILLFKDYSGVSGDEIYDDDGSMAADDHFLFALFRQTKEEKSAKRTQNLIELFLLLLRERQTVCFSFFFFYFFSYFILLIVRQRTMAKIEITVITVIFHSHKANKPKSDMDILNEHLLSDGLMGFDTTVHMNADGMYGCGAT